MIKEALLRTLKLLSLLIGLIVVGFLIGVGLALVKQYFGVLDLCLLLATVLPGVLFFVILRDLKHGNN